MSSDAPEQPSKTNHNDMHVVARKALLQLLEPLVGFALDSGLSTQELGSILREAAVRSVAAGQLNVAQRVNISGIAATTGISRAQISRILKSKTETSTRIGDKQQQSTNRILSVWHQDPKFNTPAGKPADLSIYGRGATFETLVRNHGRGIPIRAILDELTRAGAAVVLSSQRIRVKSSVAVDRGVTIKAVRSFGERAAELLSTMLQNMRDPENARFVAGISGVNVPSAVLPLFRKELAEKGADFLADLHDSLNRDTTREPKRRSSAQTPRVTVTLSYFEAPRRAPPKTEAVKPRRNFRRGS